MYYFDSRLLRVCNLDVHSVAQKISYLRYKDENFLNHVHGSHRNESVLIPDYNCSKYFMDSEPLHRDPQYIGQRNIATQQVIVLYIYPGEGLCFRSPWGHRPQVTKQCSITCRCVRSIEVISPCLERKSFSAFPSKSPHKPQTCLLNFGSSFT